MIDLDKYKGHTPGPWMLLPAGEDACGEPHAFDYVEVAHRRYVSVEGRSPDEANINARLIADAPEMLAEVKRLRQDLHDTIRESQQYRAERDEAIEALRELSHYAETSDDCQYGTLSTRLVRDIANPVLAKHGASE